MAKRRTRPDGSVVYTEETSRTVFKRGFRVFLAGSGRVVLYLSILVVVAGAILLGIYLS